MDSQEPAPVTGRYYWFFIIYMAAISAFGSFVNDMYVPSLPAMTRFFHVSASTVQLGLSFGMLGLGLGQVVLGPLSDRSGRKPVLTASLIIFTIASVVSVFSPSISFFLACRFFQGIGASGGYMLGRTMPADETSGRTLAKIMAIIGAINGVAPASAPVLGGFIADWQGWKGCFVFLAIFGAVLLLVSPGLKESLPVARRVKGDFWAPYKRYWTLMKNRAFMTHVLFKGGNLGLLFAYISSAPFILQRVYGLSQGVFGLVMGFNALFVVAGSMLALKFRPLKKAGKWGGVLLVAGVAGEAVSLWLVHSIWVYEAWMLVVCVGMGLIFTTANTLAMNEGRQDAGTASALLGVVGYLFGLTVSPLVGLGNILHSTAIALSVLGLFTFALSRLSSRLAPDLNAPAGG